MRIHKRLIECVFSPPESAPNHMLTDNGVLTPPLRSLSRSSSTSRLVLRSRSLLLLKCSAVCFFFLWGGYNTGRGWWKLDLTANKIFMKQDSGRVMSCESVTSMKQSAQPGIAALLYCYPFVVLKQTPGLITDASKGPQFLS